MLSTEILFFLITGTFFLQCMSQKQVHLRGSPEVDYPTYYAIPKTSFSCSDQLYNPGFYADTEARCQVFHYCYEHRQESFLCPMGTIFNQPILTCDYWYSSNCSLAPQYYKANAIKRNEDFDEAIDPVESQSDNLFDKMAGLYETNKTSDSSILNRASVTPENEVLGKAVEASNEPLTEKNNKVVDYNKYSYDKQLNMVDEKQLEIVKYDISGSNSVNSHKGSKNKYPSETDNMEDFIFSEDGMLHRSQKINPSQEDIYQIHPNDMNFDQEYAEIPTEENFSFYPNDDLDFESEFQNPEFDLLKRRLDMNGNYVRRRPSSRKPIIIIPEEEPEVVQLPVTKHKRKPIRIASTLSTNVDSGYTYETISDPNIYIEETVSVANEGLEDSASGEFSLAEQNWNLDNKFNDPKLINESPENIKYENNSQLHVLSTVDEGEIPSIFGSGSNDLLSISDNDQSIISDSNYGDSSEIFTQNAEDAVILPGEGSDTTVDNGRPNSDAFFGSGSEENIQLHSSDESSFAEVQDIFSDSKDTEISDMDTSYAQPISLIDTFEGSGISFPETIDVSDFAKEVNDPSQFISEYDSEDNPDYGKEASFSSDTFGTFSPSKSSENNEWEELVPAGSGEFNYLPESSDYNQDGTEKTLPEIREIDGTYYIFSDSEYQPNYVYGDSSEIYVENGDYRVTENIEYLPDRAPKEPIYSIGTQYVTEDSNLKIDHIKETPGNLDYQPSNVLENLHFHQDFRPLENAHEKLSEEFETETSPHVNDEEYIVEDAETTSQFTTEDLTYLEIMSQTPIPMLKNLFEVSETSSSHSIEDEIYQTEIISSDLDIIDQNDENPSNLGEDEFETHFSETSDAEVFEESSGLEDELPHTEITSLHKDIKDGNHEIPANLGEDEFESLFSETSDAEPFEESSYSAQEDVMPHTEIISSDLEIINQNHENPANLGEDEAERQFSETSDVEASEKPSFSAKEAEMHHTEIISFEKDINDEHNEDLTSPEEAFDFESFFANISSDTEENSVDMESHDIPSDSSDSKQKFEEETLNMDGSDQDGTEVLFPQENLKVVAPRKEADPFNPLFSEDAEILVGFKGKQNSSLKVPPVKLKNAEGSLGKSKDLKAVARGKRLNEKNLRTFNPPKKGSPVMAPSRETFRETMFTKIPSEFLKMKHSSIRPYFYNYGLKNSGLKPRAGDQFESSNLSKLNAFGKRLLAAKSSKFNIVKKYIDSYRNN